MKSYREIEFTTTKIKGDLTAGKTCYQGHLQHNAVLSERETRRRFAEYCCEDRSRTDRYLDALGEFIVREIAHGNRLNFGPFDVSLKLLGGFRSANASFDETRNAISVCLIPSKEIKSAVKILNPINVTEDTRWYLSGTLQRVPYQVYDEIVAVATVVSSDISHTDCTLEGPLACGDYWIIVQCRDRSDPNLIRCRRRIKVV